MAYDPRLMTVDPDRLRIVHYPDPALRARTQPVDPSDPVVRAIAARMIELMHEAEGVGLAAPQVGLAWRLFVTHARDADPVDRVYFNPKLTLEPGAMEAVDEGCLSLPGINVTVRRPVVARLRAVDLEGGVFDQTADGFLARVWQHEFDHLEGRLIIDRMGPRDRLATRKAIRELERGAV